MPTTRDDFLRWFVLSLALLTLALAAPVSALTQSAGLDGRWNVSVEGASRSGIITLVLSTQGTQVRGERDVDGEAMVPVTGEIQDDRVTLHFIVWENDQELPIEITARLTQSRLDGEAVIVLPNGRRVARRWTALRSAAPRAEATDRDIPVGSLADVLRVTLQRTGWPGITVAWRRADGTSGAEAAGFADLESRSPMTITSRMPAGSVGKTFVSAVTLLMASEGLVNLDAPVSEVLGDLPWFNDVPNGADLTLRFLLQHSGGLPDHVDDLDFARMSETLFANPDQPASPEELIATLANNEPLFAAGQGYAYSDTGYLLIGLVLEEVTDRSWWELLHQRALQPAGLEHSYAQNRRDFQSLATGYPDVDGTRDMPAAIVADGVLVVHPATEWTGGGVVSTSPDLARWASILYGGEFLPEAAFAEMITSRAPGSGYGLGVREATSDWGIMWGHDGWFPGYRTKLAFFPGHELAVAIQVNTDRNVDLTRLLVDVLALLEPID